MGDYLAGPQDIHMMRDINNTQDVLTKAIPKSRKLGFKVTFMTICVLLERDAIKWAPVFRKNHA